MKHNFLPGTLVCVGRDGTLGYAPGEAKSYIVKQNTVAMIISTQDFLCKWPEEVLVLCYLGVVEIPCSSFSIIQ